MLNNYSEQIEEETLSTLLFKKQKSFDYEKEFDLLGFTVVLQLKLD